MYSVKRLFTKSFNKSLVKHCMVEFDCNLKTTGHKISDSESNNNIYMDFNEIPGPKSYPVIGTLYNYLPLIGDYDAEAMHKTAWLNWKRYGPLVRESLMPGTALLHVYDPDDIEAVFRQEGRLPARRSHLAMEHYRIAKSDVYNTGGLLATNGTEWGRLRSTFQKNFASPKSVQCHVSSVDKVVGEFINWINMDRLHRNNDFLFYLNRLYLEITGLVAFDQRFNSFSETEQLPNSRSSKMITAAFESNSGILKLDKGFLWKIFKTPLYRKLVKSQTFLEEVSKQILLRKTGFYNKVNDQQVAPSFLDSFLQQPNIDLKDITGMMVDILMAAIDTTSYSTSFALYHLALNADCQQKLHEEAMRLLPETTSAITADILSQASYTRSCIKESLRLNPIAIGVGRILQKDIVLKGYLIPKSTVIVMHNMTSSRLPQYVKDPLSFIPNRWQRDNEMCENLHPFLSLPFGFGPRSCIARRLAEQNICVTLLRILREFELRWEGGDLGIQTHLVNKPDQPIQLALIPRGN